MNSCSDRPHSSKKQLREKPNEMKRQRPEKEPKTRSNDPVDFRCQDKSMDGRPMDSKSNLILQIRLAVNKIEAKLDEKIHTLEDWLSSENEIFRETMSQPDVTETRDQKLTPDLSALFEDVIRIEKKMYRHTESEGLALKTISNHYASTEKMEKFLEELRMERDALLERVLVYLEQISSLKSKIEEQRCSVGAYERQVNAEYENQIRKLESENEDLKNVAVQKEKQLKDANEQLRQMNSMLKLHETQSWKKKNEESVFIAILKNDLQSIWNEKIKMEEEFKRLKRLCGYNEVEFHTSASESLGTILRKSKSMSDLTVEAVTGSSSMEVSNIELDHRKADKAQSGVAKETQMTTMVTRYHTKPSLGEPVSADTSPYPSMNVSRQRVFQELSAIERKLAEQTEEVKKLHQRKSRIDENVQTVDNDRKAPDPTDKEFLFKNLENVSLKLELLKEQLRQSED